MVSADFDMTFNPEPLHGQLWARETYVLNVTVPDVNISDPEYAQLDLAGTMLFNVSIRWRGAGQYHHGTGVTGYSYELSQSYFQRVTGFDESSTNINFTLDRDAYRFGMKPFEEVQIIFKIDVYLEVESDGNTKTGPLLETKTRTMLLLDEEKVEYLEDLYEDLQSEINLTLLANGLDEFNRTKYAGIVESMNHSLAIGDYPEALEQWDKWDNKERLRMFTSFTNKVNDQTLEFEFLKETKNDLENLQTEYDFLEDKYVAIFGENRQNLSLIHI